MNIYEQTQGETLVLQPTGRLDSNSSHILEQELAKRIDAGAAQIVLDLKDLDYISSAGLRAILISAKQIEAKAGRLALCALQSHVREVFDISGFSAIIDLQPTLDEAVVTVSAPR